MTTMCDKACHVSDLFRYNTSTLFITIDNCPAFWEQMVNVNLYSTILLVDMTVTTHFIIQDKNIYILYDLKVGVSLFNL